MDEQPKALLEGINALKNIIGNVEKRQDLRNILEKKIEQVKERYERVAGNVSLISQRVEDFEKKLLACENATNESKFSPAAPVALPASPVSMKLYAYDGKTNWEVYKIQFGIISEANRWTEEVKACQLVASFRREAAEVLQTLTVTELLNLNSLFNARDLQFGQKFSKDYARLQMKIRDQSPEEKFKESSDENPSWQDIAPFHPTTKRYWALWDSLHLRNGVLYRKWESDDGKTFRCQLILPKAKVSTVLKKLHGSPTGGHFGVMKTLQNVRERFYWNNVHSDVEKCCRICDLCAAREGPRKRTRGRLQLYNVGAPFERIAFDILGPLPRSSDGNINILVVMDYFTKWPEAYPIPVQEASTVAEVLVQHWIS
ncbi:retrovirus-related Pol polyprotein from transposon 412 [Trichonephila clavipes]|nr:retrovirus-related Pol polyprotein from transposon 412 [Trichonephila clavipes]